MRSALILLCMCVYSLEASLVSPRDKRSLGSIRFKSFKMTRRPSPPVEELDVNAFDAPDTSFVVEKPPATMKPQFIDTTPRQLTLEEKFNLELAAHGVRTTTMPAFFQTTQGGLWDFL
ncbi:hypothetical protein PRIPAC_90436 [Pristionchus pacificus]|uniref:Uncharacterized protein n=1 Tax=Pristionchus pacificus TaxID=54126 RepID=A0A2A6B7K8_PRIPA|nr:hypothetical protein PRIPAC_90436 [Pristionchus pacificus]|eukprot:PDM61855.1 hypothetical protein PRIPAC_51297 [Pristionchus pacificus]